MHNLDDVRAICAHPGTSLDAFLAQLLPVVVRSTASKIGVIGLVDHASPQGWLRFRSQHAVGTDPAKWMLGHYFLLPIGGADLPHEDRSISGYVAYTKKPYNSKEVTHDPQYLRIDPKVQSDLAVPILLADTLLGVLDVESEQPEFYTDAHQRWLCDVAALMAEPLAHFLDRTPPPPEALDDALNQLDDLRKRGDATVDDFLQKVLRFVIAGTNSKLGFVSLVDDESGAWLRFRARQTVGGNPTQWLLGPNPHHQRLYLPIGDETLPKGLRSLSGLVAYTKRPLNQPRVQEHPCYYPNEPTVQSELVVPILYGDTLLGVLNVESEQPEFYTDAHQRWLCDVAQRIAERLAHLEPWDPLIPVLQDISPLSHQIPSSSYEFLREVIRRVTKLTRSQLGLASIADGDWLVLRADAGRGTQEPDPECLRTQGFVVAIGGDNLPEEQRSLSGYVAYTGKARRTGDAGTTPYSSDLAPGMHSALAVPILLENRVLGVLSLQSPERQFYTPRQQHLLNTVAQLIAWPLSAVLTKERFRKPPEQVQAEITAAFAASGPNERLAAPLLLEVVARHVAEALHSTLCTIWLFDEAETTLVRRGGFGLPAATGDPTWQALHDAFGPRDTPWAPGREVREAHRDSWGRQALDTTTILNCGPQHDAPCYTPRVARPFVLVPLLAPGERCLGVLHVGLKLPTPENPLGSYTAQEDIALLQRLQEAIATPLAQARKQDALHETAFQAGFRKGVECFSRNLHDALSPLTLVLHDVDAVLLRARQEERWPEVTLLERIEELISQGTTEALALLEPMRAPDFLRSLDFISTIASLMQDLERDGIDVDFRPTVDGTIPPDLAEELLKVVREAITNIRRHAETPLVRCSVNITPQRVTFEIRDYGRGFAAAHLTDGPPQESSSPSGHGLDIMPDRVRDLGGTMQYRAAVGEGVALKVTVPIPQRG